MSLIWLYSQGPHEQTHTSLDNVVDDGGPVLENSLIPIPTAAATRQGKLNVWMDACQTQTHAQSEAKQSTNVFDDDEGEEGFLSRVVNFVVFSCRE